MSAVVGTLKFLWPFLKEMVLGDKTMGQAIKTNKMRVLLLFLILGSFATNIVVVPRTYEISAQYLDLEREHKKAVDSGAENLKLSDQVKDLEGRLSLSQDSDKKNWTDLEASRKRVGELVQQIQDIIRNPPMCKPTTSTPAPPLNQPRSRFDALRDDLERIRKEEEGWR